MGRPRDVDEGILQHAVELLSIVRKYGHPLHVDVLEDIPDLLVFLFENITMQTIPSDMKSLDSLRERADTLQTILDTIEQTLSIPLTHLSGIGLASLDRRQLSDALDIFDDLVRHCLADTESNRDNKQDESIPMSVLDLIDRSPDQDQFKTPPLSSKGRQLAYHVNLDQGFQPRAPIPIKIPDPRQNYHDVCSVQVSNHQGNDNCYLEPDFNTDSSTTIAKQLFNRDQPKVEMRHQENNKHASSRAVAHPSVHVVTPKLLNGNISVCPQRESKKSKGLYEDRYVPYKKDRLVAKSGNVRTPVMVRKPSVKTFRNDRYPPQQFNQNKRDQALPRSFKTRNIITENEQRPAKPSYKDAKSKEGNANGKKRPSRIESFRPKRRCSNVSIDPKQDKTKRVNGVNGRKDSVRNARLPPVSSRHGKTRGYARSPADGKKRIASVISTKARKHSEKSPKGILQTLRPLRRGDLSPQSTSLYYSFMLLEEFDYVTERLKKIRYLKQELLDDIRDLDHEAARLEAVMSHVHLKSSQPSFKMNQRDRGTAV